MDQPWVDELLEKLGQRYRLGNPEDAGGYALLYRFGKAEFRSTRVIVGAGEGRHVGLTVDFRIPRDAASEDSEPLLKTLIEKSLAPRGFTKTSEEESPMTTESGKASGSVRSVQFRRAGDDVAVSAKAIRAIVESIDLPVVLGVHEADDLIARDPRDRPKKLSRPLEPMEKWEYTLSGGMLKSLTAVVDPNVRTLVVMQRKLVSSQPVSDTIKLAHVSRFLLERAGAELAFTAEKKEGGTVPLAQSAYTEEFVATAERLAAKVMIPLEKKL